MSRCPVCSGPIAPGEAQPRERFVCPHCAAPIGVAAWHSWSRRVLCGLVAGSIAGLTQTRGGALFALLVALAVAVSDLPIGAPPLVRVGTRTHPRLVSALLRGAAVGVCAGLPYALLRALAG